jgi:hypothetical protein
MRVTLFVSLLVFCVVQPVSASNRNDALAKAREGVQAERQAGVTSCEDLLKNSYSKMPNRCLTTAEQYQKRSMVEWLRPVYNLPDATERVLSNEAQKACASIELEDGMMSDNRCDDALLRMAGTGMASVTNQGLGGFYDDPSGDSDDLDMNDPINNPDLMEEELIAAMQVSARACQTMHESPDDQTMLACTLSEMALAVTGLYEERIQGSISGEARAIENCLNQPDAYVCDTIKERAETPIRTIDDATSRWLMAERAEACQKTGHMEASLAAWIRRHAKIRAGYDQEAIILDPSVLNQIHRNPVIRATLESLEPSRQENLCEAIRESHIEDLPSMLFFILIR